jgi:hypothetical protein
MDMRTIRNTLFVIFIIITVVMPRELSEVPLFIVYANSTVVGGCNLDYKWGKQTDHGYMINYIIQDSTITDSLVIILRTNIVRIFSISFSRNGTKYISADTFPSTDSAKWILSKWDIMEAPDTLRLYGSYLELCRTPNRMGPYFDAVVTWHLKKKFTFNKSDTFTLIYTNPKLPLPVFTFQPGGSFFKPIKAPSGGKFVAINPGLDLHFQSKPIHSPIFDIIGKKQTSAHGGSFIFIIPPAEK